MAGIRTPEPLEDMRERLPGVYEPLVEMMDRLERHYRDMQDLEFTVEEGTLYMLQTRTAKRTAAAALKCAVDMVAEGLISKEEAVARIDPGQLDQLLHPMIDPNADFEVAARGLNASPGAASGAIVLDADTAADRGAAGESVILVRWETTPDDIHGMIQAKGVLTAHGGMTSHAAVVARGMGKPCVAGCEGLSIDLRERALRIGSHDLAEGDVITINGATGEVVVGEVRSCRPRSTRTSRRCSAGPTASGACAFAPTPTRPRTPHARARVRRRGHRPHSHRAHVLRRGAAADRAQEMILAEDEAGRRSALDRLLPMQQGDFEGIFEAMAGLPVTIRLLDPPLHEFLPSEEEATDERTRRRIRALEEANPMLGTRGCRLGLMYPEIYEMQVRAIILAAKAVQERAGEAPLVEIMHPLVAFQEELRPLRELTIARPPRRATTSRTSAGR